MFLIMDETNEKQDIDRRNSFIKPQSGNCQINGLNCWNDRDKIQEQLGYIPGEISFFDDMSGKEFLKFAADYRKLGNNNH